MRYRDGWLFGLAASVQQLTFEIVPHPRSRGDWLLKPTRGAPFGLWFRDLQYAVSYARWIAQEVDHAEVRIYSLDGKLAEVEVAGESLSKQ